MENKENDRFLCTADFRERERSAKTNALNHAGYNNRGI
jgi:hypothetical protein